MRVRSVKATNLFCCLACLMQPNYPSTRDKFNTFTGSAERGRGLRSVGPRRDLVDYSELEWRGHTDRAATMRKGYNEIATSLGFSQLRVIRGDNYCAIRACVFQMLSAGLQLPASTSQLDSLTQRLSIFHEDQYQYLQRGWTFGGRLSQGENDPFKTAHSCIHTLISKLKITEQIFNALERQEAAVSILNSSEDTDILLMEAVKILMLLGAIDLHKLTLEGAAVPTFAMLMFARDTSSDVESFVRNHLNTIGDSGGLEQIEMYLLGHVLGVIIKVIRPSQYGKEDFVTLYSEESELSSPLSTVSLIAEDDRHYNVLL